MSAESFRMYVCPQCKGQLVGEATALTCIACQRAYPILDGIPDFILEDLTQSDHIIFRKVKSIDRLAKIYETSLWYPLVLNLYGGFRSATLKGLVETVSAMIGAAQGFILDVACGPGTFGRRLASLSRRVYGIDISWGMLRQGAAYLRQEHVSNMHFARSKVESLPFEDACFDAALCCGALHLFVDTVGALREIGRTIRPGAPLAVVTFHTGGPGILRFRRIQEHIRRDHGLRLFEIPALEGYLAKAGFENYRPETFGSILVFSANKRPK